MKCPRQLELVLVKVLKSALRWTSPGKRMKSRLRITCRKIVLAKLQEKGLSWGKNPSSPCSRFHPSSSGPPVRQPYLCVCVSIRSL